MIILEPNVQDDDFEMLYIIITYRCLPLLIMKLSLRPQLILCWKWLVLKQLYHYIIALDFNWSSTASMT